MKFILVCCKEKEEEKTNIFRCPQKVVNFCKEHFRPYTIEEMKFCGEEGLLVQLVATKQDISEKWEKWEKILEQMITDCYDREGRILIPKTEMLLPRGKVPVSEGKLLHGFFAKEILQKALEINEKSLKECKVVIMDGGNALTDLVLQMVYPAVNDLSVYTDREEDFLERREEIYEDCGLYVQTIGDYKNPFFREADVILNCGCYSENYDYAIKTGAFYFDISKNKRKLKQLAVRREDLFLADGLVFQKDGGEKIASSLLEGLYSLKNIGVYRILTSGLGKGGQRDLKEWLMEQEWKIDGFTCFEKEVYSGKKS